MNVINAVNDSHTSVKWTTQNLINDAVDILNSFSVWLCTHSHFCLADSLLLGQKLFYKHCLFFSYSYPFVIVIFAGPGLNARKTNEVLA